jgi:predicted nucleotidyltransferase
MRSIRLSICLNHSRILRESAAHGVQSLKLYGSALYDELVKIDTVTFLAVCDPTTEVIDSFFALECDLKPILGRMVSIIDSRLIHAEQGTKLRAIDIMDLDPNCTYVT